MQNKIENKMSQLEKVIFDEHNFKKIVKHV